MKNQWVPSKESFDPQACKNTVYEGRRGDIRLPQVSGLSRKQRSYLDLAAKLATNSEVSTHHHGAIVVNSGRVLAMGVNRWRNPEMVYTSTTDEYNHLLTVHAEVRAISQVAPEKLKGATVYVAKVGRDGKTEKMSRPCNNCMQALVEAGVKHVIYTV